MGLKCYFLIFLLGADSASYNDSELATPGYNVVRVVDGQVILECELVPPRVADDIEVRWFRNPGPQIVHLYQMGQDQPQDSKYAQRTNLFKDQFGHGNMSLLITKLTVADEGEYHCSVKQFSKTLTATVNLKIAAEGYQPTIELSEISSENVKLECTSERWYPAPTVTWLDEHNNHLSANNPPDVRRSAGGFFNVSSAIDLKTASVNKVTCVITNDLLHSEKFSALRLSDQFYSFNRNRYIAMTTSPIGRNIVIGIFALIIVSLLIWIIKIMRDKKKTDKAFVMADREQKRLFGENEQLKATKGKMQQRIETLEKELKEAKQEDREPDDCNSSLISKDKQHQDNTPM